MKAIISSNYDDRYLFFLPIVTWCWNKLGVDVICLMPYNNTSGDRFMLVSRTLVDQKARGVIYNFEAPEHKEATYAQVSRIYAGALNLSQDEILITADVDMAVFGEALKEKLADFDIFGYDLVPEKQYPICFVSATVKNWRSAMQINGKSLQECLDKDLGHIECEHFRGNYWGFDQEKLYNKVSLSHSLYLHGRAKPGTQFATRRVDRDNMFYEENINDQLIDAHLWRPGFTEENFPKILNLLQRMYPNDNFDWLISYTEKYRQLL